MKRITCVVAILFLSACAPAVSTNASASSQSALSHDNQSAAESLAPTATLLPDEFLGRWDASLAACKTTSDMKLTVTQAALTFWESAGQITGVTVNSPNDVTVKAAFSGEGEQWNRDLHIVLSDNGSMLTVDDTKRVRCP